VCWSCDVTRYGNLGLKYKAAIRQGYIVFENSWGDSVYIYLLAILVLELTHVSPTLNSPTSCWTASRYPRSHAKKIFGKPLPFLWEAYGREQSNESAVLAR